MKARITKMYVRGVTGSIKAFFNVSLGELEIRDCRLIEGSNGLFVGFPSRSYQSKDGKTQYINIVDLAKDEDGKMTASARKIYDAIFDAALQAYEHKSGEKVSTKAVETEDDDLPF